MTKAFVRNMLDFGHPLAAVTAEFVYTHIAGLRADGDEIETFDFAAAALGRGLMLAIAAPEWAVAVVQSAVGDPDKLATILGDLRELVAKLPVAVEAGDA